MGRREFLALAGKAAAGAAVPILLGSCRNAGTQPAPKETTMPSAKKNSTIIVADPIYAAHQTGSGHPESPQRYTAIMTALDADERTRTLERIKPRQAQKDEILLCHTEKYYGIVKECAEAGENSLGWPDTNISRDSFAAAITAVGGLLDAVDAVVADKAANAFCVVRPPGHHALSDRGMGFCLFSNVAIAARYAQKKHGVGKILIADWDVHHGNGTQAVFYDDPSVFFFSTHQWPHYPGTGRADETGSGKAVGTKLNCPLPAGAGRKEILGAFTEKLLPAADKFKPEFIFISAGFDSRRDDPLGGFALEDQDFADLTGVMTDLAARHAGGRLVSSLEGGYNLTGLASASVAHVKALIRP